MIDVNVGAFRRKRGDVKSVKEASNAWVLLFCQMYVTPRHLSADNHRRDSLTFRDWCRVLSLSDCRYSLNPLNQTRID